MTESRAVLCGEDRSGGRGQDDHREKNIDKNSGKNFAKTNKKTINKTVKKTFGTSRTSAIPTATDEEKRPKEGAR